MYVNITEFTLIDSLPIFRVTRETIQKHSMERLRNTHAKLNEVSSATEIAAVEMLNGLDRTLGMIDQLEADTKDNRSEEHTSELQSPELVCRHPLEKKKKT